MHAHHTSARLAPKKANIVAKMVRGMSVPDAVELLRNTSKKGARLIEDVLLSAMANAEHNFKQNAQSMIVKTIIVNQGTAYRRGVPMARGRVRPIRKFLCHIEVTLGFPEGMGPVEDKKPAKKVVAKASQTPKGAVKAAAAKPATKKKTTASDSSAS